MFAVEKTIEFMTLSVRWERGDISAREAAGILGITHSAFLRWVRENRG